jgi:NADH-quinone oxidoreductase subunit H
MYSGSAGFLQPLYDFLKLLFKKDLTPKKSNKIIFTIIPYLTVILPIIGLLLVFNNNYFEFDILIVFLLLILETLLLFLAGYSSVSRYGSIGAMRIGFLIASYEVVFLISIVPIFLFAEFNSFSQFLQNQIFLIFQIPISFFSIFMVFMASSEFLPFDAPHAESEIVAGYFTEYSGKKLAFLKLGRNLEMVLFSVFISVLFLSGLNYGFLVIFVQSLLIISVASFISALFARYRIDQILSLFWKIILPLSVIQLLVVFI